MPVDPIEAYSMPVDVYKGGFGANYGSLWDKPGDDVNLPVGYGTTTFGAKSGTTGDIPGALGGTELETEAALGEYETVSNTGFVKPPEDYTAEQGESWLEKDYSATEETFGQAKTKGDLRDLRASDKIADLTERNTLVNEWADAHGYTKGDPRIRKERKRIRRQQRRQRKDLFRTYKGGL
jgi:hypothetical protein